MGTRGNAGAPLGEAMNIRKTAIMAIASLLAGCATQTAAWKGTYKATLNGNTGIAKVVVAGSKVRMESQGQRKTNTSILRYDKNLVWLIAPTLGKYAEFGTNDLIREFPLFFDPSVKIEKKEMGRELIDGKETVKYAARVTQGTTIFTGTIWEAIPPLPVPVKWQDERGGVAVWEQVETVPYTPELFEVPKGMERVEKPEQAPVTANRQGATDNKKN